MVSEFTKNSPTSTKYFMFYKIIIECFLSQCFHELSNDSFQLVNALEEKTIKMIPNKSNSFHN
jgi:hypothetical protein